MFQEIITDVTAQINANGEYANEFANDGVLHLRGFGEKICRVFLKRTGRLQSQTDAEICLIFFTSWAPFRPRPE